MKRWLFALLAALGISSSAQAQFTIDIAGKNPTNIEGLWWNASESGWGAAFTQQFHIIFVTLYTYDASGYPTWYVVTDCRVSGNSCSGALYRAGNGQPLTTQWRSTAGVQQVGFFTATFSGTSAGTLTFTIDGVSAVKSITRTIYNTSGPAPAVETSRQKTERLVGGTWSHTYTLSTTTFTDRFTFGGSLIAAQFAGDFYAVGRDQFNTDVLAGYSTQNDFWGLLNPGITIDEFFTYQFNTLNSVGGCYYLISPAGSTNLSRCYSFSGSRSPPKVFFEPDSGKVLSEQERVELVAGDKTEYVVDQAVLDQYLRAYAARKTYQSRR
ncbi:hypothetical protein DSM104443_02354 [Usitatibacter rugosus]|uniref:Uncharacterized protein n=1 Tax=Usitatibacter rugosus TaxID=2732067 RepID=A0A6M4GVF1_9PROT|nr:hypothetical protein [Usitatibacter rugosus]QJR11281.1 hypothetical protein DSM104443_02354 [Usitatibacter rugosus]